MHDKVVKCLGLVTQYNSLGIAPGSLSKADNAVISRENIAESRRGYKVDATLSNNITQMIPYAGKVLAHNSTTISYGPGSYANYSGTYSAPTNSRLRAAEAASNLYFTTSAGIKVFTDTAGTAARASGVARALDPSYALNAAGSGFLADTYQCAYRCVLQKIDANSNVITGYPSQRLWVINAAGASKNIDLTVYLPSEAIAGDIIQFYRTTQFSGTSSDSSGDEMGMVYQQTLTSTNISAGYVTFTDSVTDALIGATLYTSPSEEGIGQANSRPPLAKDIALYRSAFMMYANTQSKQRLFFTLVGVSGLSSKTITLGGVTYNFGGTEIVSGAGSPQAKVFASGVLASDIDNTARSLIRVINRYASNTSVYAYYLTGPDDLPGQIMIEEKGIGASAFTLQSSDTAISPMFFPEAPVSPATNTKSTSSNTVQKNALFYSKDSQHEHVPVLNYLPVGPSNKEILRIAPLRESLIVIKEEGVYRLTGENPQSFQVTPLDLTVLCKAKESVFVVSNQCFMLSNQGVVAISETGIQIVSRDIEPNLKKLLINTSLADYTFACGYESEHQYMISTISDNTDLAPNQTLVYNVLTKTWTRWSFAMIAGCVEPVLDKLYFAKTSSAVAYVERKEFTNDDYADPESSITIISINQATMQVVFSIAGTTPDVGWVISQNSTKIPIGTITLLGGVYVAIMQSEIPDAWATGAATIYPNVGFDIDWNVWTYDQPGLLKQVRYAKILTDSVINTNSASALFVKFRSNFDEETEEVLSSFVPSGFGTGSFGSMVWGGGSDPYGYPCIVPLNKQYCTRLTVGVKHKNALEKIVIAGYALDFEVASDRIGA